MNCEASSARRSILLLVTVDGGATSDGNSRARLLLTCRFMATGAEVALPDPAHAGESTTSNESLPRLAVNGRRLKNFQGQNSGCACCKIPPSRTAPTWRARPVASSVSTASAHNVAGPVDASNLAPGSLRKKRL